MIRAEESTNSDCDGGSKISQKKTYRHSLRVTRLGDGKVFYSRYKAARAGLTGVACRANSKDRRQHI